MPRVWIYFIVAIFILLILRLTLFFLYAPVLHDGEHVSFSTTLLSEPLLLGNRNAVTVGYGNMAGSLALRIYFDPTVDLHYGQTVKISGNIMKRLIKNATIFSISNPKIEANVVNDNPLLSILFIIRQKTKELYEKFLPQSQASLLLGIVLGIRGNFSPDYMRQLQAVGVVHVIAASGMNVSMVGGFLIGLLGRLFRRKTALFLSILGICLYMVLAGLQPSIVRAGIMMVFIFTSQIFGRQYMPLYGLLVAIAGMLLFTPSLLFDIGFQLSVAATLGILFIKPLMPKLAIFEDTATTTAAQMATLPILLANFGQYGLTSILVNALILWTVPLLMILGGVAACISFLPFLAQLFIYAAEPLLWFFESVIVFFASLHLSIGTSNVPSSMVIGYYLVLVSFLWLVWNKRKNNQIIQ